MTRALSVATTACSRVSSASFSSTRLLRRSTSSLRVLSSMKADTLRIAPSSRVSRAGVKLWILTEGVNSYQVPSIKCDRMHRCGTESLEPYLQNCEKAEN